MYRHVHAYKQTQTHILNNFMKVINLFLLLVRINHHE